MAYLADSQKLLFFLNPRTGSTALSRHLQKHLKGRWLPSEDIRRQGKLAVPWKHTTPDQLRAHDLWPGDIDGLIPFTTVRNPFDSLVSLYSKLARDAEVAKSQGVAAVPGGAQRGKRALRASELGFNGWILENHAAGRISEDGRETANQRFSKGCAHRLRFEHLQEDFDEMCRLEGLAPLEPIARINKTDVRQDASYRDWYTQETRDRLLLWFRWDLDELGYRF